MKKIWATAFPFGCGNKKAREPTNFKVFFCFALKLIFLVSSCKTMWYALKLFDLDGFGSKMLASGESPGKFDMDLPGQELSHLHASGSCAGSGRGVVPGSDSTLGVYLPSEKKTLGARRWCGNEMPLFEVKKTHKNCCNLWQRTKIQTINLCCLFCWEVYPPWKLTYPLKIHPWKRRFLLETIIFRGYVSFREGRCCFPSLSLTFRMEPLVRPGPEIFSSFFGHIDLLYMIFSKGTNLGDTPRKINMEHNHGGLEDHFPF